MNINPMQLIQMMRNGNPQQVLTSVLTQQADNNPVMKNVLEMVQRGDMKGIEALARNMAHEKGIDVNKAVAELKKQFGM